MQLHIKGVVPAMATPLQSEDLRVDFSVLEQLCDFLIERGVGGIFALGSTGECVLLSMEERKRAAETVLAHVNGRVPVIVNCGHVATNETIELVQHAAAAGAPAAAAVFPFYYPVAAEQAMDHFRTVAHAVPDMPLFAYYYRRGLIPEQTLRLRETAPNIVGMKDAVGDYAGLLGHVDLLGEGFCILEGSEDLAFGALTLGIDGLVSGIATAFPEPFVKLYRLVQARDYDQARRQQIAIHRLAQLFYGSNPWGRIKKALQLRGIDVGPPRAPIGACGPQETADLASALQGLGLL
jgi:dihydrodipicolinate synthase/N-acetylneuraminate lyase